MTFRQTTKKNLKKKRFWCGLNCWMEQCEKSQVKKSMEFLRNLWKKKKKVWSCYILLKQKSLNISGLIYIIISSADGYKSIDSKRLESKWKYVHDKRHDRWMDEFLTFFILGKKKKKESVCEFLPTVCFNNYINIIGLCIVCTYIYFLHLFLLSSRHLHYYGCWLDTKKKKK